jgi:hypothetical protein
MKVRVREMTKRDVEDVLGLEKLAHTFEDEDFQVAVMRPWGLDKDGLMVKVRQRADLKNGVGQATVYVIEARVRVDDTHAWVLVGSFTMEALQTSYEVSHLTIHPHVDLRQMLTHLASWLKTRLRASVARKSFALYIPDVEEAKLPQAISFWRGFGAHVKLARDYYGGRDAWEVSYREIGKGGTKED